jgi:hypothetical protein
MKKRILGLVIIGFLALAYFNRAMRLTDSTFTAPVPTPAVSRMVLDLKQWKKWWPGNQLADSVFSIDGRALRVHHFLLTGFDATDTATGTGFRVSFVTASQTETIFTIRPLHPETNSTLGKLKHWQAIRSLQGLCNKYMNSLKSYFSSIPAVYEFNIEQKKVINSPHISISREFNGKPNVDDLYGMIDQLRVYIGSQNRKAVDDPIMNMLEESGKFKVMVALATDTILPSTDQYKLKQMVLGNILIAEVKGGPERIKACTDQMQRYVSDFGKSSPAIPFQRLITDRRAEPDSTKWITTINYPVFQ